jgi:hypothetical protein
MRLYVAKEQARGGRDNTSMANGEGLTSFPGQPLLYFEGCGSWKGGRTDAKRVLLFFSTTVVLSSSGVALSFGKEQALSTEIKE